MTSTKTSFIIYTTINTAKTLNFIVNAINDKILYIVSIIYCSISIIKVFISFLAECFQISFVLTLLDIHHSACMLQLVDMYKFWPSFRVFIRKVKCYYEINYVKNVRIKSECCQNINCAFNTIVMVANEKPMSINII